MIILNFGHMLTPSQRYALNDVFGEELEEQYVPVQIDQAQPLGPQVTALADAAGLSARWSVTEFLVVLPYPVNAAALLIAEIHGRCGALPTIIQWKVAPGTKPALYDDVAFGELINLDNISVRAMVREMSNKRSN